MKTEIWDCNDQEKKRGFSITHEEIAEHTRIWLANGGRIDFQKSERVPESVMVYISSHADMGPQTIMAR